MPRSRTDGGCRPGLAHPLPLIDPATCRAKLRRRAGPGSRRSRAVRARGGRLGDEQPGQRMLAGLLGGGGQAEHLVLAPGYQRSTDDAVAELGPSFGQGSRLVEGDASTRASRSRAAPPLTSTRDARAGRSRPGPPRAWPESGPRDRPRRAPPGLASDRSPAFDRSHPPPERRRIGPQETTGRRRAPQAERPRVAVRRPLQGRTLPLGLGQQADHLAERCLVCPPFRPGFPAGQLVDRPGKDGRRPLPCRPASTRP